MLPLIGVGPVAPTLLFSALPLNDLMSISVTLSVLIIMTPLTHNARRAFVKIKTKKRCDEKQSLNQRGADVVSICLESTKCFRNDIDNDAINSGFYASSLSEEHLEHLVTPIKCMYRQ